MHRLILPSLSFSIRFYNQDVIYSFFSSIVATFFSLNFHPLVLCSDKFFITLFRRFRFMPCQSQTKFHIYTDYRLEVKWLVSGWGLFNYVSKSMEKMHEGKLPLFWILEFFNVTFVSFILLPFFDQGKGLSAGGISVQVSRRDPFCPFQSFISAAPVWCIVLAGVKFCWWIAVWMCGKPAFLRYGLPYQ